MYLDGAELNEFHVSELDLPFYLISYSMVTTVYTKRQRSIGMSGVGMFLLSLDSLVVLVVYECEYVELNSREPSLSIADSTCA